VTTLLREWMERNFPPWFLGLLDGPRYRLFGICRAQACPAPGRRAILHTPRQWNRCADMPLAVVLTEHGWLLGYGIEPESVVGPASKAWA
jgi:hypothetical protein